MRQPIRSRFTSFYRAFSRRRAGAAARRSIRSVAVRPSNRAQNRGAGNDITTITKCVANDASKIENIPVAAPVASLHVAHFTKGVGSATYLLTILATIKNFFLNTPLAVVTTPVCDWGTANPVQFLGCCILVTAVHFAHHRKSLVSYAIAIAIVAAAPPATLTTYAIIGASYYLTSLPLSPTTKLAIIGATVAYLYQNAPKSFKEQINQRTNDTSTADSVSGDVTSATAGPRPTAGPQGSPPHKREGDFTSVVNPGTG
jgi:hypothetical protein